MQEEMDAHQQVEKTPSPSEETSHQRGNTNRKRQSPFNTAALMEQFKHPRRLVPPSIPDSTQESLASASQSQRTVDVIQQYPAMGEHMHTFPAEPQIARMNRNTSSTGADASRGLSAQSLIQQQALKTLPEANLDYKSLEEWLKHQGAKTQLAELNPTNPISPIVDLTRALSPQASNTEVARSENASTMAETEPAKIEQKELVQPERTEQVSSEAQAAQHKSEQPKTPPAPGSALITAQDIQNKPAPKPPSTKSGLDIRYTIIKSRFPKFSRRNWGAGGLAGKTMDSFCDEVAALIGRPVLRSIYFNLTPAKGGWEIEDDAERGKAGDFERVRDDFIKEIRKDKRLRGNTEFTITIEPDPVVQDEKEMEDMQEHVHVDDDDDDDDVEHCI